MKTKLKLKQNKPRQEIKTKSARRVDSQTKHSLGNNQGALRSLRRIILFFFKNHKIKSNISLNNVIPEKIH